MKKLTAFALLLAPLAAIAQDKVVKKKISLNLTEEYRVSAADKSLRQGLYMVTDADGNAVVRGKYDNGKKVGTWLFYNPDNKLAQQFDYNSGKLLYTNQDSGSYVRTDYSIKADDKAEVQAPVKIGGSTLAFLSFYNSKDIPASITKEKSDIEIKYTIDVKQDGQIGDVYAEYESNGMSEKRKLQIRPNSSGLLDFIPAKIDGKAVDSKVVLSTTINTDVIKLNYNNQIMNSSKN